MKLRKDVQYGILFVMYLCRSGRCRLADAAHSMRLSVHMLEQVARKLRKARIIKSIRGPGGGYELAFKPGVIDILNALQPVRLLSKKDLATFGVGESEERAFAALSSDLQKDIEKILSRKVDLYLNLHLAHEQNKLDSLNIGSTVN